jgi:glycosyltransferase involved in cell wall biosynthesis
MAAHTHINSQLVKVVRNGIATRSPNQKDVTAAQEEIKLNGASKIIITAGRLSEEKGLDVLLEAFAQVTQKIAKVHLLILGKGPLEGVVKGLSRKLGLDSSVQLLGFRRDILPYLALSHLYVNSSLYEGLPMSLLEAMAAGLPVIASTVGGIPEVVEGNMTGILVEPGDPQSLADAMLILLKDQALVERLRQNAVKKVAEDFHISQTVKNYENLYLSLMNAGSGYERLGAKD